MTREADLFAEGFFCAYCLSDAEHRRRLYVDECSGGGAVNSARHLVQLAERGARFTDLTGYGAPPEAVTMVAGTACCGAHAVRALPVN